MPGQNSEVWFTDKLNYQGLCTMKFSDPQVQVEGQAVGDVKEDGSVIIQASDLKYLNFEKGIRNYHLACPQRESEDRLALAVTSGIGSPNAKCSSIAIEDDTGTLTSTSIHTLGVSFGTKPTELKLFPWNCRYKAKGAMAPVYWVLPLINFEGDGGFRNNVYYHHPLRLRRIEPPRPEWNCAQRQAYEFNHLNYTRIIRWSMFGQTAFIDKLPDYTDRIRRLQDRKDPYAVTAIAVGVIPCNVDVTDSSLSWFPYRLLSLLSLATGQHVSTPWLELRDSDGKLVSREHLNFNTCFYRKCQPTIAEIYGAPLGSFLECGLQSETLPDNELHALAHFLFRIESGDSTTDEKWTYIARLVEWLALRLHLQSHDLTAKFPPALRNSIDEALLQFQQKIRAFSDEYSINRGKLEQISDKVRGAAGRENKFTASISELIEKFGFYDLRVMEKDYIENPRSHGRTWLSALGMYRADAVHRGYSLHDDTSQVDDDHFEATIHLHDLLTRAALTMIGYNGLYNAHCAYYNGSYSLDWVKPDTSADRLGYHRSIK